LGKWCAVVEIAYCNPIRRAAFEQELHEAAPDAQLHYICFENDVQKANANRRSRRDGRNLEQLNSINRNISASYTIPTGADVRPIWPPP
jgi:hypothetical protein